MRLRTRLGFMPQDEAESVVVVQADPLNTLLPTLLVVPLNVAVDLYAGDATAVRVTRGEAGSSVDQVADATQVQPVAVEAFALGVAGRLKPRTLVALDRVLKRVLGLA